MASVVLTTCDYGGNLFKITIRGYPLSMFATLFRHSLKYRTKGMLWGHQSYDNTFFYTESSINSVEGLTSIQSHPVDRWPHRTSFVNWSSSPVNTRHVFMLQNAVVDTLSGRVYDDKLRFLADSSAWNVDHALLRWPAAPKMWTRDRLNLDGKLFTFIPSQTYYHWLTEDLPSLLRVKALKPDVAVFIRKHASKHILSTLQTLGIHYEIAPSYIFGGELIYESRGPALIPQKIDIEELSHLARTLPLDAGEPRRIYISRRDSGRMPSNELEVEGLMRELGITIVSLTGKDFSQQVKLFLSADLVVGTHGAGLANIAWCQGASTTVVEIRHRGQPDCFETLAALKEAKYLAIESQTRHDWRVQISDLRKLLEQLGD